LVEQIFIDVNPACNLLIAVISIADEKLKQFADVNGLKGDVTTLARTQDVKYGVIKQLENTAQIN